MRCQRRISVREAEGLSYCVCLKSLGWLRLGQVINANQSSASDRTLLLKAPSQQPGPFTKQLVCMFQLIREHF